MNRHQRAQRNYPYAASVGIGPQGAVLLTFRDLQRGRVILDVPLPLGAAYELASVLTAHVQGALAGTARPWDSDPGRTPFGSRGRRGAGAGGRTAASRAAGGTR